MDILLGTSNPGKLREVGALLAELPVRLLSLRDVGLESLEIDEPYETFTENAAHKAQAYASASGLIAVADDSGLQVDALGGRPGVYSARYAEGSDRDRYMKLLGELEGVPDAERTARFVCVAAAFDPRSASRHQRDRDGRGTDRPSAGRGDQRFRLRRRVHPRRLRSRLQRARTGRQEQFQPPGTGDDGAHSGAAPPVG